jgi:polar amino acid transport system substrate-binding protein
MIRPKVISVLFCALCSVVALPAATEELSMTASSWPPYVYDKRHSNGFLVALVSDALKRAGYQANMVVEPWPNALEATQNGDYDVYCGIWFTDDRAETLTFSEPFIDNEITFAKRSDRDFQFRNRADLNGLKIGVVDDYAYSDKAYDTTGIDIAEAGSVGENIKRLLAGDIDLILADRRVVFFEVDKLGAAKKITVLPKLVNTRGLRIAVSKKRTDHREIITAFEKAITAMKADGRYNAILANHRISH